MLGKRGRRVVPIAAMWQEGSSVSMRDEENVLIFDHKTLSRVYV
jgi:hypothetical protein